MTNFYSSLPIQSHNAIFNFVLGARNLGKTWAFKVRALARFIKHHKKTIWIRRFQAEAKETCKDGSFFSANLKVHCTNLIKGCDFSNYKWQGNKGYWKNKKGEWEWFIQVVTLCHATSQKSVDDPDVDTMVFDEFTCIPSKYKQYRGNEVIDMMDLIISKKREHGIKVFFLGNKESWFNPYFGFFNIKIEEGFKGIRTFKNGSIAVEVNDDVPDKIQASYKGKLNDALAGTNYDAYLTGGTVKTTHGCQTMKVPGGAILRYQFDFGNPVSLWYSNGYWIFKQGVDKNKLVVTYSPMKKYPKNYVFTSNDVQLFDTVIFAYKMNFVRYENEIAYESAIPVQQSLRLH